MLPRRFWRGRMSMRMSWGVRGECLNRGFRIARMGTASLRPPWASSAISIPPFWIPACAGMTVRRRGNDGGFTVISKIDGGLVMVFKVD